MSGVPGRVESLDMKVSVVLALLLAALAAAHPGLKPEAFMTMAKYVDTCTKKHGTKQGDIFKLIFDKSPIEDQALKCTLDCYMIEAGYLKDGKINWNATKERTKKAFTDQESIDKAIKIADACEKNVVVDENAECPFGEPVLRCLLSEAENQSFALPTIGSH